MTCSATAGTCGVERSGVPEAIECAGALFVGGGRLGLWVFMRFRLSLGGRALHVHALCSESLWRSELILTSAAI